MNKLITFFLICSFLLLALSGCASNSSSGVTNRDVALKGLELSNDINVKDSETGNTPLQLAVSLGGNNLETVKSLIAKGADVNTKNNNGWTPLRFAVADGQLDVVKVLINKGAEVNAKDNDGWTSLHFAAMEGHREVAEFLISNGADVNAKTSDGHTPLHWAAKKGHQDIVELLKRHGAKE